MVAVWPGANPGIALRTAPHPDAETTMTPAPATVPGMTLGIDFGTTTRSSP
jgi:hypothetical protein